VSRDRHGQPGHTEAEALANLKEATDLYLESFPQAVRTPAAIRTFELAHGETAIVSGPEAVKALKRLGFSVD